MTSLRASILAIVVLASASLPAAAIDSEGLDLGFRGIGNAGLRYWFEGPWAVSAEIRLEQHFCSWERRDIPSRANGEVDDYFLAGVSFGVSRRF